MCTWSQVAFMSKWISEEGIPGEIRQTMGNIKRSLVTYEILSNVKRIDVWEISACRRNVFVENYRQHPTSI